MDSRLYLLTLLFLLCPPLAGAETLSDQRQYFIEAENALSQGDLPEFRRLQKSLADYPLYPYLAYAELEHDLRTENRAKVEHFLSEYADTPLAPRLRLRWLDQLARERNWQLYRQFYRPHGNTRRQCTYLRALLNTGESEQAFNQVPALWLHGRSQPKACDPLFSAWRKAGHLTAELVWQRIDLAMGRSQHRLAGYLGRFLPQTEQPWLDLWRRLHRKPQEVLTARLLNKPHPYREKILLHAIKRQTRSDALEGLTLWQKLKSRYAFAPPASHAVERRLAFSLTRNEAPQAYAFVQQLVPGIDDSRLQETQIRAALYQQDWPTVLHWLDRLPATEQQSERWRYWRARSLAELGQEDAAQALFQALATERSYHGFLAADRTDEDYALLHHDTPGTEQGHANLLMTQGILRARELFMLQRSIPARREWRDATQDMSREKLMAAATLAESWGWHDQAIFTLARTGYWDDLELRFPIEHQPLIERHANNRALKPAFVLAVIRQESAFQEDAHSPAGARGLMQLMPATARRVAKRHLKQKPPGHSELKQPATNIALGTAYLREVLDKWEDNPVLATASYNAGPHRVSRWLPSENLPADIWVELIPYRETRGYVQRVLSYQVIYEMRLGLEPGRMSDKMAPIKTAKAYALGNQHQAGS